MIHWVHKFAVGKYCGSMSFDEPERAQAFAEGYRSAAEDTCSSVAAYACTGDGATLMRAYELPSEVATALEAVGSETVLGPVVG